MPAVQQAQSETKTTWRAQSVASSCCCLPSLDLLYLNFTSDTPIRQIAAGLLPGCGGAAA